MKKILLSLVIAGLMTSSVVYADKIYSWVDEKGVTHYGENPPKDTPARQLNARTGHSDPVEYSKEKTPDADVEKRSPATAATPSAERCELVRKNLQLLTTNPRVKTTDKNGETRIMTQEEMQAQVTNLEEILADECTNM